MRERSCASVVRCVKSGEVRRSAERASRRVWNQGWRSLGPGRMRGVCFIASNSSPLSRSPCDIALPLATEAARTAPLTTWRSQSPLRSVVDEAQLPHLAAPGSQSHSQPATGGATHTTAVARARARDQARRQTGTLPNVTLRLATGNGGGSGTGVPIHGDKRSAAAGSTGRLAGGKSARLATRG